MITGVVVFMLNGRQRRKLESISCDRIVEPKLEVRSPAGPGKGRVIKRCTITPVFEAVHENHSWHGQLMQVNLRDINIV